MWMTTATDHIHQIGRAHGSQGQAGSLGETVSLSRLDSLCESQVPAGWRPAILREASTGGTESPDCWDQSGSSLFSPWHLSNLLHPHLSVCSGAASPGHSLIKSECPECPWRRGGGGLRGWREKRETGSWGKNHEGGGEAQTFRERPFVLLSWQLMLGSDILRGSGDSFGDIPVCDSMTNLCLYLILESVETARRTAVWGCRAPVCRRVGSFPLCPASALKHQDQCPGGRDAHVKAETALLPSQGLIIRSPVNSTM